jgi:hypothetical protein
VLVAEPYLLISDASLDAAAQARATSFAMSNSA